MSMFSFAESLDGHNPYDLTKYVDRVSQVSECLIDIGLMDRRQLRFKLILHWSWYNSFSSSLVLGRYWSLIPKGCLGV
jgi:hypothetical protein